jgi:hypothetical protein
LCNGGSSEVVESESLLIDVSRQCPFFSDPASNAERLLN